MRYLGVSVAVLVAAMPISLTPLGRTARASDHKPVIRSGIERNTILPLSASSPNVYAYSIERYGGRDKKPTGLAGWAEFHECTDVTVGKWINISDTQDCGKEKCGKVTTRTVTYPLGQPCSGTFPFAAIFYEWTAHNNQRITDTFDATWTSPDNTIQFTFNITVPAVRPDHETTVFENWWPENPTVGPWKQKLVPPSSDPTFDFSGETVQEFAAAPAGPDTCWYQDSGKTPFEEITGGPWTVGELDHQKAGKNVWGTDKVGYGWRLVLFYQSNSPTIERYGFCGTKVGQQMKIHAPSDPPNTYTAYGGTNTGNVNLLGAEMKKGHGKLTTIWYVQDRSIPMMVVRIEQCLA